MKGRRVETPHGPGVIVGPWLTDGMRRGDTVLDLREATHWIVALDVGQRRVVRAQDMKTIKERGST